MASGAITSAGKYKYGGVFTAASQAVYSASETTYVWYSSEAGGYIKGTDTSSGSNPSALGVVTNVSDGASVYGDNQCSTTAIATVTNVDLFVVSRSVVGNGSITTSGTIYGNRYIRGDQEITFTASASTGSALSFFKKDGSSVQGAAIAFTPSADASLEATFVLSSYSLTAPVVVGSGSVKVYVNNVEKSTFPVSVSAGDVIKYVCTASEGNALSYIEIDGSRSVTTETSVTVVSRSSDATIESSAVFVASTPIVNSITYTTGGGSIAVKNSSGANVPIDANGNFNSYFGASYTIEATPSTGKRMEGIYVGTRKVASTAPYQFTQGDFQTAFNVVFVAGGGKGLDSLRSGSSSHATDNIWNGCYCTSSNIGDVYTFVPYAASGYSFVQLYVEDLNGTGKGVVIPSGQSLVVTLDFLAKVVAIFKSNSEPVDPSDEDQGGSPSLRNVSIGEWEGALTRMTARWVSRRNVFIKPVALSCARVYADGYGASHLNFKVHQYESPNGQDVSSTVVNVNVVSQNAFRLVSRRPEKYVELEVSGDVPVLEMAASTSMGGLWQNT